MEVTPGIANDDNDTERIESHNLSTAYPDLSEDLVIDKAK